MFLLVSISGL